MSTVFGVEYYCNLARMPLCNALKLPTNNLCALPVLDANGITLTEPAILVISAVAGLTGVISAAKVFKNKDARGAVSWWAAHHGWQLGCVCVCARV